MRMVEETQLFSLSVGIGRKDGIPALALNQERLLQLGSFIVHKLRTGKGHVEDGREERTDSFHSTFGSTAEISDLCYV